MTHQGDDHHDGYKPMSNEPNNHADNDDQLQDPVAQLLAKAGLRFTPPPRMQAEVRAAVHAEWQHIVATRAARRRTRWLAVAALLLAMCGGAWFFTQLGTSPVTHSVAPTIIASIERVEGDATLNAAPLKRQQIHAGDVLSTHAGGLRLTFSDGIQLRVAANSMLQFVNANEVALNAGQVYVDSHARAAPLVINTVHGQVSHLGTRYFVDSDAQSLRVAVRSGSIAIHTNDSQLTVNAMEQLQLSADRHIVRSELNLQDESWQWADALAEPFVLENRSVAEFVQWVAGETGYEVQYASNLVQAAADRTILHGQQTTLPPLQSLQVVLAATDFHARLQGRQVLITQQ